MTSRNVEVRWGCAEMMMYGYLEITCQGGVMVMGHGSYLEVGTIHTYLPPSMTCEGEERLFSPTCSHITWVTTTQTHYV